MTFSSIHFVFLFLPFFLIAYYLIPKKWWRSAILFLGSLLFFVWADPPHIHWLLISILLNYFFGIIIDVFQARQKERFSKIFTILAVVCNLGILVFYKYSPFILANINSLVGAGINLRSPNIPLGISYLSFSGLAYVIDVHNKIEKAERNILKFGNFLIMFPKLLQGPITRIGQVRDDLLEKWLTNEEFTAGVRRFIVGLGKKVLLADNLAIVTNKVFSSDFNNIGADLAWVGIVAYSFQIFFDFSGYTDMAIGLGQLLGFHLPENFNYPYISRSITEFWRRWHMSLTSWFRTFLFIPLEFKRKKVKFFRQQSNILIVFLLTGLWHGASWNFVIWGGYFGVILALEATWLGKNLKKIPVFFQHFYSLALILVGWIFFKLNDFHLWTPFFKALFGANGFSNQVNLRSLNIVQFIPLLVISAVVSTPLLNKVEQKVRKSEIIGRILVIIFYSLIFVLSIAYILSNGYSSFLYAQF